VMTTTLSLNMIDVLRRCNTMFKISLAQATVHDTTVG
jgi:hypothetical protein